jgi:2-polyprenyl-3-methyl-5-hydroxy-6-metoxy-1,4-benzoquinol methylase
MMPSGERLDLDFPAAIAREFPEVFDAAWQATDAILGSLPGVNFSALARHSRGLLGYEWSAYHRCNVVRAVRVGRALARAGSRRVLDFGAYFGNFALMAATLGCEVDAVDSFGAYAPALDRAQALMRSRGVTVIDFTAAGFDLRELTPASYDAVLCLGVIEHIPHSPRGMLAAIDRVLKPGGTLVLDTPNLAYLYKRRALAEGRSIFPPIADQFLTEPPFEGHHREFTIEEVRWMLQQQGHESIAIEAFDFSVYALGSLEGDALVNYREMQRHPELRELILAISVKPPSAASTGEGD